LVAAMERQRLERAVERDELIEHDRFVRALIRRFIADPHLADELTQETWLAALRQSAASRFLQRAWLGTVARNLAFQAMRANARRLERETAAARSLAVEPDGEVHIDADLRRRVLAAVEALHEPYLTVVRLRFYDDLAPTEIAARLRVPHETVRTQLKRGLQAVHAHLRASR
jgi:RNA polymerase sigma factor (sigma-70 family)